MSGYRVTVVDYGMGNLRSVSKALESVGADVDITGFAGGVRNAERLVLPGVGAFGKAVGNLESAGLGEAVRDFLACERPFLGICLGMQLLFESSEEDRGIEGLGVFRGACIRFRGGIRVPHMGWNTLGWRPDAPLGKDLPGAPYVYFVHSYFVEPADEGIVAAKTEYGSMFVSAIHRGAVAGVQFHPEKSQDVGLKILRNFLEHM